MRLGSRLLTALVAIALLLAFAPTASAHKTSYSADNKIKVVWGFLDEPALAHVKNGLDLRLSDNATGAPIAGVTSATLHVELHYGDHEWEFEDFGAQFGSPGRYTGVVTPTRAGLYKLHLEGTINGSAVDMEISAAHEIRDVRESMFPDKVNNTRDLEGQIGTLKSDLAAAKADIAALKAGKGANAAPGAPAAAVLVLAGIAGLMLRRRV